MIRTSLSHAFWFLALILASSNSFASRSDLINEALNKNLEEREVVTGTYKQNDAAGRPVLVENRANRDRIQVELDSELASGSKNLKNFDNPAHTYREVHVEAHLDREVRDVDHSFEKTYDKDAGDQQKSSVRALLNSEG